MKELEMDDQPINPAVLPRQNRIGLKAPAVAYDVYLDQPSEIVIGLVGPLGTDTAKIATMIEERLKAYNYALHVIKISRDLIPALAGNVSIPRIPKYERAKQLIALGNQIREEAKNKAILAIAAAAEIARLRPTSDGPVQKVAYVISSLKLPQEVEELRKIYGRGFFLFALHADRDQRVKYLSNRGKDMAPAKAMELIEQDEHEQSEFGQHTRDTFHLADFFVADEDNNDKLKNSIWRCLDLIFGNMFITPTFDEYAMFMAFSASLRSADLSRQVGAVVAKNNEILSTGANDCPTFGGGLYWPEYVGARIEDAPRGRDFKRDGDSNVLERLVLIQSIAQQFPISERPRVIEVLKQSDLQNLTEFGRVVHAEMEALLLCARNELSCRDASLFCTTFPCHNCAKHIIAAGIREVVYVEPYPKSKALDFHDDAISTENESDCEGKVNFKPFIGVGPRLFFELFSLSLSTGRKLRRKEKDGKTATWIPAVATPRIPMLPISHRNFEAFAIKYISDLTGGINVKKK